MFSLSDCTPSPFNIRASHYTEATEGYNRSPRHALSRVTPGIPRMISNSPNLVRASGAFLVVWKSTITRSRAASLGKLRRRKSRLFNASPAKAKALRYR